VACSACTILARYPFSLEKDPKTIEAPLNKLIDPYPFCAREEWPLAEIQGAPSGVTSSLYFYPLPLPQRPSLRYLLSGSNRNIFCLHLIVVHPKMRSSKISPGSRGPRGPRNRRTGPAHLRYRPLPLRISYLRGIGWWPCRLRRGWQSCAMWRKEVPFRRTLLR
jgi:hypothetical protein